jgi:hypothetical protein
MALSCPRCYAKLPEPAARCANCNSRLESLTFVAAAPPSGAGSLLAAGGGADCFFCPEQPATGSCTTCGRFVCTRCEVDWAGQKTCLTCLHAGREIREDDRFVTKRTLWDNFALALLIWPAVIVPFYGLFFSLLAAPVAIFMIVKNWNAPRGIVPRGRGRQIAALVVSGLLIAGAAAGVLALMNAFGGSPKLDTV